MLVPLFTRFIIRLPPMCSWLNFDQYLSLQAMNLDFIRVYQMNISSNEDFMERNLEHIKQKAILSLGKLEESNISLEISDSYEKAPSTLVSH